MNQITRISLNSHHPEHAPVPKPPQPSRPVSWQSFTPGQGYVEFTSPDAINNQAGVREGLGNRNRSLAQRLEVPVPMLPQRYVSPRNARSGKTGRKKEDGSDGAFLAPLEDALDLLSRDEGDGGKEALESHLRRHFEPLQQYHVLFEAFHALENEDLPPRKKKAMRRTLDGMMSELVQKHPHELRKALQESDELVSAVDAMSEDMPTSVRDLRFLIGAKARGNMDTPLTPLTMLKALIRNFGADKCVQAMGTLRSRMMSGF